MKNNISFNSKLSKFGIGLFETIKIENEPIDFDLHMNRLYNSVRDLNIKIDIDKSTLKDKVLMYIKHNNIKNILHIEHSNILPSVLKNIASSNPFLVAYSLVYIFSK